MKSMNNLRKREEYAEGKKMKTKIMFEQGSKQNGAYTNKIFLKVYTLYFI